MKNQTIENTLDFVKKTLKWAEWGHDFFHIERVYKNALNILQTEWTECNELVVKLWALLHDIADSKFHNWDETVWPRVAREFLEGQKIEEQDTDHVIKIIENISFKWWNHTQELRSHELDIVQDADRLDALWAIWIARTFTYRGHFGRQIYNPNINPNLDMTKQEYKDSTAPSLNHFYEKLLLLKDKMNTETWKNIAEERHKYMEEYLKQFHNEWEAIK